MQGFILASITPYHHVQALIMNVYKSIQGYININKNLINRNHYTTVFITSIFSLAAGSITFKNSPPPGFWRFDLLKAYRKDLF